MTDFNLEPDELMILQKENVMYNGAPVAMALSDKNIICVKRITKLFKADTFEVIKFPLSEIRVFGDKAQVSIKKDKNEFVISVVMEKQVERFGFRFGLTDMGKVKKEAEEWADKIAYEVTGTQAEAQKPLVENMKSVLGSVGIKFKNKEAPKAEKKTVSLDKQIETVRKLKELVDMGALSQEEFEKKKKEIMGL